MIKRLFVRALQVVPALVVTGLILTACSDVGGEDSADYSEYKVTEVNLTDGRTIECVYFGVHLGYDCNWNPDNNE